MFLCIPSQLRRLHSVVAALRVQLARILREAGPFWLLPQAHCPSPGCAYLPSIPCPGLSSLTFKLPFLWPPMSIPSPPENGPLLTPLVIADSGVQDKQACLSLSWAQKSLGPLRPPCSLYTWPASTLSPYPPRGLWPRQSISKPHCMLSHQAFIPAFHAGWVRLGRPLVRLLRSLLRTCFTW